MFAPVSVESNINFTAFHSPIHSHFTSSRLSSHRPSFRKTSQVTAYLLCPVRRNNQSPLRPSPRQQVTLPSVPRPSPSQRVTYLSALSIFCSVALTINNSFFHGLRRALRRSYQARHDLSRRQSNIGKMPTDEENVQYLYLVLTAGGPPTVSLRAELSFGL